MSDGPVLVTTPTGNVGRALVRNLLVRGIPVRGGVRDPSRASLPAGVEPVRFDYLDPSTHAGAVAGTAGLFLLRPIQVTRMRGTLLSVVDAAQRAGVRHSVLLSVEGAERQPWLPHRRVEKALQSGTMSWTFLRPNHFMQNLIGPYRPAIAAGRLELPCGEGRIAFVDCDDLGEVGAMAFADPSRHAGRAYPLTGPEAVSFPQLADMLTSALGRPITYRSISALRYFRALRAAGAPLPMAGILTGVHVSVRRGAAATVDPTSGRLLERRPRTVADFIAAHAAELGARTPVGS